jgi:hypothetical protein
VNIERIALQYEGSGNLQAWLLART